MEVIERIYQLRKDFILIGLTGRTGSGCSTVAKILRTSDFESLKSLHQKWSSDKIDNNSRKNRIVYNYMHENWQSFISISASDIIFFYVLLSDFEEFIKSFSNSNPKIETGSAFNEVQRMLSEVKDDFLKLSDIATDFNNMLDNGSDQYDLDRSEHYLDFILNQIPSFREKIMKKLASARKYSITEEMQMWGNNIRNYNSISHKTDLDEKAPSCLARKINQIVKYIRAKKKKEQKPTCIVIDALRNPYEILYFRERYSAFYLMSINTTDEIRRQALLNKGYHPDEIEKIDKEEKEKSDVSDSYARIDIDKCIELSDIHIAHDGTDPSTNRDLINQIFTYLALIKHPGIVSPSPEERLMQIAYTAKLNSGCLSRQVGAAVTDEYYSVKSIGWNTAPQGQTPCTLRSVIDLQRLEDEAAYSQFEKTEDKYRTSISKLYSAYEKQTLRGLPCAYCFKDIYTTINPKQQGNQVHTRSLHAEENSFLQLAKYGSMGIKGGILFTTASCCELCAKKAYQLGVSRIIYIDAYPGISRQHILECGTNRPSMELFKGVIGRAYVQLYNPMLPQKDELAAVTGISVKYFLKQEESEMKAK